MSNTRKPAVGVAELRKKLPAHVAEVIRGKQIVRPMCGDPQQEARERLLAVRKLCRVGDVLSPADAEWNAER